MQDLHENAGKYLKQEKIQNSPTLYTIISLNMIEINDRDTVVFKLKNLKNGTYLIKTPQEIIHQPEIVFNLCKQDLMQVSYLAGCEHSSMN